MKFLTITLLAAFTLSTTADAHKTGKKHYHKKSAAHKRTYYSGHDEHTSFKTGDAGRPSPYKGDNVPENDGVKKNEERNKNYQTNQPLPPNNGSSGR